MSAIEIRNLSKNYGDFTLDNISLTLPSGCIMGLIGENGAGKSTTIKLILDMIKKDTGTVTLLGRDNQDNIHITKEDIGVVLDEVGFTECLNAGQIGKIMKYTFRNWDEILYQDMLSRWAIPKDKEFKKFSQGMKMKLGIAVAISHQPKLLILDEATNGLDPVVRDEVVGMLNEFTREEDRSILISSHIVSDLEKICDYIAFLHKGKLLLCEEKDILLEKYGAIHCTREQLQDLPAEAIIGKKESSYGVEVVIERTAVKSDMPISPVTLEEVFVCMVKKP